MVCVRLDLDDFCVVWVWVVLIVDDCRFGWFDLLVGELVCFVISDVWVLVLLFGWLVCGGVAYILCFCWVFLFGVAWIC